MKQYKFFIEPGKKSQEKDHTILQQEEK